MGVVVEKTGKDTLDVKGVGIFGLRAPRQSLDCGHSVTTMSLLTGVLAAQPFAATLIGAAALSRRPMMQVIAPLRARGARIEGQPDPLRAQDITAPLVISGLDEGTYLGALQYESPVSSDQVKSAILLSGLYAHGPTYFKEPTVSPDHTERFLHSLGVPIQTMGSVVELDPARWGGQMAPFELEIPGDLSTAAFLLVAAQLVEGSRVTTRGVGVNPTRSGLLEIARDMGAGLRVEPSSVRGGEPIAEINAWFAPLRAIKIGGELVGRAMDEILIACALAARATGTTVISDVEELGDRLSTMAGVLRAFGVKVDERAGSLVIEGKSGPLDAADVDSRGDRSIAMTAVVLGLAATGPTRVRDVDCITTSFPKFVGTMRALGARIDVA